MAPLSDQQDDARARTVIDRLQKQFRAPDATTVGRLGLQAGANRLSATRKLPTRPLLETAVGSRFAMTQGRLDAVWKDSAGLELSLPARSSDAFRLRHRDSGVTVQAKLAGARDAPAALARGMAVYDGAGPTGGAIVHRLSDAGTEDWVTFETRPDEGRLTYDVSLTGTAGLRLVGNTLEFLDRESTPRLRVSPPYVVGRNGAVVEASLSVSGCAVDHDPSAPWDRATVPPGSDRCRVDVRWDVDAVEYPAIVDPSWSSTASMSTGRIGPIGAAISTNRVLVAGGLGTGFAPLATAELYDPTARTWAATASMAVARSNHAAAIRGTGTVLVTGGIDNAGNTLSSVESYNPSTGAWTTRPSMNKARAGHRLTTLSNGDVLVTGGTTDGSMGAQRFSNTSATWSSAGTMLSNMSAHTATLLNDGRVLVVGEPNPVGENAMLFQPSSNTWSMIATLPQSRSWGTAVRLADGKVLLAGGSSGSQSLLTAELFDPATGGWSQTGGLWQTHVQGAAVLLNDNRVLLFGNGDGNSHTIGEIYDPTWGTWRPAPVQTQLRNSFVAVRMQNDRVLIAGGTNMTAPLATATEFIPTTTATTTTEYKTTPAACSGSNPCALGLTCTNSVCVDTQVLSDRPTDLWASVHRPNPLPAGRLPLIIFLHGNHWTCGHGSNPRMDDDITYTTTGTCPTGYTVVPNHRGYDYIANELASRNYLVVSINANRGINMGAGVTGDSALIAARGRLVLKHLMRLSEWNRGAQPTPASIGVSLQNKIDLTQVGLMGHSRGGDGVRSAPVQYSQSGSPWPARIVDPVTFRGIFEIGPTDYNEPPNNALNIRWNVLLPMCDGDMSNLDGVKPYDRMFKLTETTLRAKSTYTVWGANHNFFNTEWQGSDSFGCTDHTAMFPGGGYLTGVTGSPQQRQSGFEPLLSFFVASVGNTNAPVDNWFSNVFNPESPRAFSPFVDRGYTPGSASSQSLMLEDFLNAAGTSSYNIANNHTNVTVSHGSIFEHDSVLRGGDISWSSSSASFQTNFANPGSGLNLSSYQTLDLRLDRVSDTTQNTGPTTDFNIQLVNANGTTSGTVPVGNYLTRDPLGTGSSLTGPVGGPGGYHTMLQTARIPLTAFSGATLTSIRGVRLVFSSTVRGRIYVANIRAGRSTVVAGAAALAATTAAPAPLVAAAGPSGVTPGVGGPAVAQRITAGNTMAALRSAPDGTVTVELKTGTRFLGRNALLTLQIGDVVSTLSAFTSSDASSVRFTLDRKQFDAIKDGAPIRVGYGDSSDVVWEFGAVDKSRLVP